MLKLNLPALNRMRVLLVTNLCKTAIGYPPPKVKLTVMLVSTSTGSPFSR